MKYRLHFMPKAMQDLAEIRDYIAADNPVRAGTFSLELWEKIQSLKVMPNRCPFAPEAAKKGRQIRHFVFGVYRILFVVHGGTVKVLRIVHGMRVIYGVGNA